jgi:hypothetical protein
MKCGCHSTVTVINAKILLVINKTGFYLRILVLRSGAIPGNSSSAT